jgi:hypothetical protein
VSAAARPSVDLVSFSAIPVQVSYMTTFAVVVNSIAVSTDTAVPIVV